MSEIFVATKSFIVNERRALIVQRSNYANVDEDVWELVGGGLRFEEDLLEGLTREIEEEVALKVHVEKLLYASARLVNPLKKVLLLVYLSYTPNRNVVLSDEHKNYKWADKKQLLELLDIEMRNAIIRNSILDILNID